MCASPGEGEAHDEERSNSKIFRRYQHEWWCMKVTCGIVTLVPEQIDCSINWFYL